MMAKELLKQKSNAELMVLDALQSFTKQTQHKIKSIQFDVKDGHFQRVILLVDEDQ